MSCQAYCGMGHPCILEGVHYSHFCWRCEGIHDGQSSPVGATPDYKEDQL